MFVVLILFLFFSLTLLCYYFCIFYTFINHRSSKETKPAPLPVSVIICAKDEAKNLQKFLPEIYKQNYPDFEVILINDRSIDRTFDVMKDFEERYPTQTKLVNVPRNNDNRLMGNKKYALTLGIKAARNNVLLFTDADCKPAGKNWIQQMTQKFNSGKQIVLGYGKYNRQTGFLNKLIRFETLQTALQYFSYALKGIPYMGVGRNLAYTKELFMQNNGFYSHLDIMSGDDDLFINETATTENTAICSNPEAFTISQPKESWPAYIHQKRRHISTASHYKPLHRNLLGLYYTALLGFWLTAIILLITQSYWQIVAGVWLLRIISAWYINDKANHKLQEKDLSIWFPVLEISLLLFQLLIFVINIFKKPSRWAN